MSESEVFVDSESTKNSAVQNIYQLAKNIVTAIQNGKSVTSERKNSIINMANEIMQLTARIDAGGSGMDTAEIQTIIKGCIKEEIVNLKEELKRPTYAQVTKATPTPSKNEQDKPQSKPALIITSNSETKQGTIETWRKSFSFKNTTFAPSKVTPLSNTKLRVEFDTAEQRDQVLNNIDKNQGIINVEIAKKLRPMIQLKGISKDIAAEELIDILKHQNEPINELIHSESDLILRFKRKNKNDKLYNAVLLTTPLLWRKLIKMERVNLDHQKIHVEEFSTHLQCFKCLQFGHTKNFCKSDIEPCSHCASLSHKFLNCTHKRDQNKLCCYNCVAHNNKFKTSRDTKHSATSNSCPTVCIMINRAIQRTDYGY